MSDFSVALSIIPWLNNTLLREIIAECEWIIQERGDDGVTE